MLLVLRGIPEYTYVYIRYNATEMFVAQSAMFDSVDQLDARSKIPAFFVFAS